MPTLHQYFTSDFNRILAITQTMNLSVDGVPLPVQVRIHLEFDANAKFISCYIPDCREPLAVCATLLNHREKLLAINNGIQVQTKMPGEGLLDSTTLAFSGRVFFYCESEIPVGAFEHLKSEASQSGISIHYRSSSYAKERTNIEKPQAFIAHDSRDKDSVAKPIAIELQKLMCFVWFDEFSLKVGDPLRESIEKGIKECKKCIVILTPNFLSNPGWTKTEFNSVFTKEIIEQRNVVLPVWKDVTKRDVYEYCPTLADRVAVDWQIGLEKVVNQLHRSIS